MIYSIERFFKSINTPSVYFFLSSDVLISSTKSISACELDILVRNPYWLLDSILFLSIHFSSLLFYSFSRILENWHSRDIGI